MEDQYHLLCSLHHGSSSVLYPVMQKFLLDMLTFTFTTVNKTSCSSSFGRFLHKVEYLIPSLLPFFPPWDTPVTSYF